MNHILTKVFENEFKEDNYKYLVVNLFNRFDFSRECSLKQHFTEDEKQKIRDFTYLGTYEDTERKSLDVLIVELKGGSKVERARNLQRNLIGKYLKGNLKDSALVAFYSKDNPDWRLSFVRMDYKIGDKGAKVEIGTPPKRYSFLVGKTEPSYTAKKQLQPIISPGVTPTVLDVEKAFNIEKVTKEFYNRIAEMFTKLVGGERKIGSRKIVEAGALKLPSTTDDTIKKEFAVRLVGRLLFCWFLKKKKSDNDIPLIPSEILSSNTLEKYPGCYHSLLEPLFFQVLNTPVEKRNKGVSNDLWSKIPFLNGGLFEPHSHDFYAVGDFGTSQHLNTLKIPDEWFNELFRIFEEYNFTIDESSTIDIEISVDPEMLGRIFENLLAEINPETGETARKSTGSYYTPRPVVDYMVDESLKQYLVTQTGVNDGKISGLLSYGEGSAELTESESEAIIDALDRVKIIDPACGSGAFPMGILHKMLLVLQKIDPESKKWVEKKLLKIDNKLLRQEMAVELKRKNWDYIHKLGIIQNSIYGVDIQPIAVEISKLRFFLSLVVDEKIDDNKLNRGVVPLPNLEFKFVAANSLIGLPKIKKEQNIGLGESQHDIQKLRELRESYFTASGDEKRRIEIDFKETQRKMFLHSISWSRESQTYKLSEWNPFEDTASSWFDPEWMFGVKSGFDVAIANPPYLRIQEIQKNDPELAVKLKESYRSASGSFDIYACFVEFAINHLSKDGNIAYILPHKFFQAAFGKNLRKIVSDGKYLRKIVDFGSSQVFESATTYTCLLFLSHDSKDFVFAELNPDVISADLPNVFIAIDQSINSDLVDVAVITASDVTEKEWHFSAGKASVILDKLRKQPRTLADVCEKIFVGLQTSADRIYFLRHISEQKGFVTAFSESLNKEITIEKDIVKPLLKGADVHRYAKLVPNIWCIFPYRIKDNKAVLYTRDEIKNLYPKAWNYLIENREGLESRENGRMVHEEFYAYIYPKNLAEFEKTKISTPDIASECQMTLDENGYYHTTTVYSFIFNKKEKESIKYFLALLNSKLMWYFLTSTGSVLRGDFFRFKTNYLMPFPIPGEQSQEKQLPFIRLVDYIMYLKQNQSSARVLNDNSHNSLMVSYFEQLIDAMVYELYFEDEMKKANKQFISLLIRENLPDITSIRGDANDKLKSIFEKLFDKEHPLRKNIFFLDSLETLRIIEGKNAD